MQIQIYKLTYKSKRFTLNKIKGICPMLGNAAVWWLFMVEASSRLRQRSSPHDISIYIFVPFWWKNLIFSSHEGILVKYMNLRSNSVRKLVFIYKLSESISAGVYIAWHYLPMANPCYSSNSDVIISMSPLMPIGEMTFLYVYGPWEFVKCRLHLQSKHKMDSIGDESWNSMKAES